jgi:hypothetical protein
MAPRKLSLAPQLYAAPAQASVPIDIYPIEYICFGYTSGYVVYTSSLRAERDRQRLQAEVRLES